MKKTTLFSLAATLLLAFATSFNAYSQDYVEVGTGSYENLFIPVTATLSNSVTQQLYLASDIGSTPMEINAIAFHHKPYSSTTTATTRNIKVYLSPTYERYITQENEWLYVAESDLVYQGTFNLPADDEWVKIDFSSNFHYDGHSNIVVTIIDNTGEAASGGSHAFYATLYDDDDSRAMVGTNSGSSSYGIEILNTVTGIAAVSCANIRFYKKVDNALFNTLFSCTFDDNNSISDWTIFDLESSQNGKWRVYNNNKMLLSDSRIYSSGYQYPHVDAWAITPQIQLPSQSTIRLEWKARTAGFSGFDENEHYRVLLSTTGTNVSDFTHTLFDGVAIDNLHIDEKEVSLSQFAGRNVYIAFQHYYVEDGHSGLFIDDVIINAKEGVGITSTEASAEASVYPNPTSGIVNVTAEGLQHIEAMDITGRTVAVSNTGSVDLSAQPNGIYILRINTTSGTSMKKIMKR